MHSAERVLKHCDLAGQRSVYEGKRRDFCRGRLFLRCTILFVWFVKNRVDTSYRFESIACGFNLIDKIMQFIITSYIPHLPQAHISCKLLKIVEQSFTLLYPNGGKNPTSGWRSHKLEGKLLYR